MGDRAQVLIKDEGVYLYTHWGASGLEEEHWREVKQVLEDITQAVCIAMTRHCGQFFTV